MLQRSCYFLIFMLLGCSRASAAAQSWVAGQHNMQPADSQLIARVPMAQSKAICATLASYTTVLVACRISVLYPVLLEVQAYQVEFCQARAPRAAPVLMQIHNGVLCNYLKLTISL